MIVALIFKRRDTRFIIYLSVILWGIDMILTEILLQYHNPMHFQVLLHPVVSQILVLMFYVSSLLLMLYVPFWGSFLFAGLILLPGVSINSLGMWIVLATTSYYVRLYDDKGMWKIIEHDG
jgi:hypothetical protein